MKTTYDFSKELLLKLTPSMAYDGKDFFTWQKNARGKLAQLLGMENFEKCPDKLEIEYTSQIDNATETRFTFESESGYKVPCHLVVPNGVENPPVLICLQGHVPGMHLSLGKEIYSGDLDKIAEFDCDFCIRAAKEGFAAIALEQRNFGELGLIKGMATCHEPSSNALLMGRTTIGERLWDVSRLIDVIETHFSDKVDVSNICLTGFSGGGTATAYIAALEDRIKLAIPAVSLCTFKTSIGAMSHCLCNFVPGIAKYFDMGDLMAMAYPKFYIQVSGVLDGGFPIEGCRDAYAQGSRAYKDAGGENRCCHIEGAGSHRFYADETWKVIHKYIGI